MFHSGKWYIQLPIGFTGLNVNLQNFKSAVFLSVHKRPMLTNVLKLCNILKATTLLNMLHLRKCNIPILVFVQKQLFKNHRTVFSFIYVITNKCTYKSIYNLYCF